MKPVPQSEASPMIACVLAAGEVRDRLRLHYERDQAARARDLTLDELFAARELAQRHHYPMHEAVEIVRRSRK